eukprot:COSAG04_NODE_1247_length_7582_cov_4.668181_6_plen_267_part_00
MEGEEGGSGASCRRLLRLSSAICAPCAATPAGRPWPDDPHTNRSANDPDPATAAAVLHRLTQEPDGTLAAAELQDLARREGAAAAGRDYRLAAQLRDLQGVLGPRPGGPLRPADCSPPGLAEQTRFFLREGFCVLPGAVEPERLRRIQQAWQIAAEKARAQWERDKVGGEGQSGVNYASGAPGIHRHYFDIADFLEQDDCFLDLIDLPPVVSLVAGLCGLGGLDDDGERPFGSGSSELSPYHGTVECSGVQARVIPPEGNADGYIR